MADGHVQAFDPYHILGIDQGVAMGEIKRAYRKLSLKFHPDKTTGNKVAEEMFMKIAKAYEALTDETSKENYEKYGNPDGKQVIIRTNDSFNCCHCLPLLSFSSYYPSFPPLVPSLPSPHFSLTISDIQTLPSYTPLHLLNPLPSLFRLSKLPSYDSILPTVS